MLARTHRTAPHRGTRVPDPIRSDDVHRSTPLAAECERSLSDMTRTMYAMIGPAQSHIHAEFGTGNKPPPGRCFGLNSAIVRRYGVKVYSVYVVKHTHQRCQMNNKFVKITGRAWRSASRAIHTDARCVRRLMSSSERCVSMTLQLRGAHVAKVRTRRTCMSKGTRTSRISLGNDGAHSSGQEALKLVVIMRIRALMFDTIGCRVARLFGRVEMRIAMISAVYGP